MRGERVNKSDGFGLKLFFALMLAVIFVFVAVINGYSWNARSRAEQAMVALSKMQPGQTTQADYLKQTKSFRETGNKVREDGTVVEGPFGFSSLPLWMDHLAWLEGRAFPQMTQFWVTPTFANGVVSDMKLEERQVAGGAAMQWGTGQPAPHFTFRCFTTFKPCTEPGQFLKPGNGGSGETAP